MSYRQNRPNQLPNYFYRFHPSWVISLFQEATERLSVLESEALRLADCLAEWLVGKLLEIFPRVLLGYPCLDMGQEFYLLLNHNFWYFVGALYNSDRA